MMQEHKQIQLYVGLEEGGCVDVGAIKLDGFTLIATSELEALKAERDALSAQVETMREQLQIAHDCITCADETGYVQDVGFVDLEAVALELKLAIESTPHQCLRDELSGLASVVYQTSKALIDATETLENELLPALEDKEPLIELIEEFKSVIAATPQQCLLDVQAEAGRLGFIAGCHCGANYNIHDLDNQADEYADSIRKEKK